MQDHDEVVDESAADSGEITDVTCEYDPLHGSDIRRFVRVSCDLLGVDTSNLDSPRVLFARDQMIVAVFERLARIYQSDLPPIDPL